jgi:DNA-binding XRE family transcriptional regulator
VSKTKKQKHVEHTLAFTHENQSALKVMAVTIKALRQKYNLSQEKLAELVGCSRSIIEKVERAKNFPSFPVYLSLCRALGAGRAPLT